MPSVKTGFFVFLVMILMGCGSGSSSNPNPIHNPISSANHTNTPFPPTPPTQGQDPTPPTPSTPSTDPTPEVCSAIFVSSKTTSLAYCDNDAQGMYDALAPGSQNPLWNNSNRTLLITPMGVTKQKVIAAINNAKAISSPNDTFLFYYSGHGSGASLKPGGEVLTASELASLLSSFSQYTKKIVIIDCCDAGKMIPYLRKVKNIVILAATSESKIQDSNEGSLSGSFLNENGFSPIYRGHGFFTLFILYALGLSGDSLGEHNLAVNGALRVKEVFDFAREWTIRYNAYLDQTQEPSFYTNYVTDPSHPPMIIKGTP